MERGRAPGHSFAMDKDRTAETAAEDHGVPLTESQRVTRESLADVISPKADEPDEDGADQAT